MSVITDCPYICAPNITDTPDYTTKMVTIDMGDETVIKAGTPISADGKAANDETAIGILLNDCHACLGTSRGLVVISGRIKQDVAAEHSGVTISDEAKSAMVNITFTGDGARTGGGSGKEDLLCTVVNSTVTFSKTYNELYAKYGENLIDHINVIIKETDLYSKTLRTPVRLTHFDDDSNDRHKLLVNYIETVGGSVGNKSVNYFYYCDFTLQGNQTTGTLDHIRIPSFYTE